MRRAYIPIQIINKNTFHFVCVFDRSESVGQASNTVTHEIRPSCW